MVHIIRVYVYVVVAFVVVCDVRNVLLGTGSSVLCILIGVCVSTYV